MLTARSLPHTSQTGWWSSPTSTPPLSSVPLPLPHPPPLVHGCLNLLLLPVAVLEQSPQLLKQLPQAGPLTVVDHLQHSSLHGCRQALHLPPRIFLTLRGLTEGETRLPCVRTAPHQGFTEEAPLIEGSGEEAGEQTKMAAGMGARGNTRYILNMWSAILPVKVTCARLSYSTTQIAEIC